MGYQNININPRKLRLHILYAVKTGDIEKLQKISDRGYDNWQGDPTTLDSFKGQGPLHLALLNEDLLYQLSTRNKMIEALITKDMVTVGELNTQGQTAAELAAKRKNWEALKEIIEAMEQKVWGFVHEEQAMKKKDLAREARLERTLLPAIEAKKDDVIAALLKAGVYVSDEALAHVIRESNTKTIVRFALAGVDLNRIISACISPRASTQVLEVVNLLQAVKSGKPEDFKTVEQLAKKIPNIERQLLGKQVGSGILAFALQENNLHMAVLLIKEGHVKPGNGHSGDLSAALYPRGHLNPKLKKVGDLSNDPNFRQTWHILSTIKKIQSERQKKYSFSGISKSSQAFLRSLEEFLDCNDTPKNMVTKFEKLVRDYMSNPSNKGKNTWNLAKGPLDFCFLQLEIPVIEVKKSPWDIFMNWASNFWKPKQENATKLNPNTVNNPAVVGQMQFSSTVSPNGTTQVTAVKNGMGDATPSQSKEFSPVSDLNESKVTNEVQQAQQEAADTNQQEQPNQQHVPAKTDLNSTQQQPLRAMSPEPQLPIEQQSTAATTAASEKESPATIVGLKSWASSFGKSELRLRSESSTSSEEQEWALPPSDGSIQQTHTKATFDC